MIRLTRLNNHIVAINPDHISWVESTPDTTLFLIGGEKIIVRETLEELIDHVVQFRRLVRAADPIAPGLGVEGDPPRGIDQLLARRASELPGGRLSSPPRTSSPPRISSMPRSYPPRGDR